jgi:hypothetical protein
LASETGQLRDGQLAAGGIGSKPSGCGRQGSMEQRQLTKNQWYSDHRWNLKDGLHYSVDTVDVAVGHPAADERPARYALGQTGQAAVTCGQQDAPVFNEGNCAADISNRARRRQPMQPQASSL